MTLAPRSDAPARIVDGLLAAGFLLLVSLPALRLACVGDASDSVRVEQRSPAPRPSFAWRDLPRLPRAFETWYADAFGFREPLLRAHARLYWDVLGHSPEPSMLRGAQGWLFYDDVFAEPQIPRERPFGCAQLEAWRTALEAWRDWLAARGARFVVAFAPDKARIYPEFAPRRALPRRVDRLVALREHLARNSDVRFLDLVPALTAERAHDRERDWTYSPHGIHWTARGAFAAYRELASAIARPGAAPALELEDLERVWRDDAGDSWAPRLYLSDVIGIGSWDLVCRDRAAFAREPLPGSAGVDVRLRQEAPHLPRVLLLHDSYGAALVEFLAHDAALLDAVATRGLDTAAVARAEPDVVLLLCGERLLDFVLPGCVLGAAGAEQRAAFEASRTALFAWDDSRPAQALGTRGALRLATRAGALELEAEPGGALDLPAVLPAPGRGAVLRAALDVREPTRVKVLVLPAAPVRAGPREVLDQRLEPGAEPFHLRLWDLAPGERLALHFVLPARGARLRALELREVELPAGARD